MRDAELPRGRGLSPHEPVASRVPPPASLELEHGTEENHKVEQGDAGERSKEGIRQRRCARIEESQKVASVSCYQCPAAVGIEARPIRR